MAAFDGDNAGGVATRKSDPNTCHGPTTTWLLRSATTTPSVLECGPRVHFASARSGRHCASRHPKLNCHIAGQRAWTVSTTWNGHLTRTASSWLAGSLSAAARRARRATRLDIASGGEQDLAPVQRGCHRYACLQPRRADRRVRSAHCQPRCACTLSIDGDFHYRGDLNHDGGCCARRSPHWRGGLIDAWCSALTSQPIR